MAAHVVEDEWSDWQAEIDDDPNSHIFVSGGLGCGKTNLVPKIAINQALKYPRSRGFIAGDTFDQVMKSVDYELAERLRKLKLRFTPGSREKPYVLSNGSQIWYESYQKQAADYKGPEWDWGIGDEGDNKDFTREKYEMLDGRIGRNRRNGADAKFWLFMNPVSHGHFAYQDARERALPGYVLHEISTYRNRRYLREGYIEKQEAKYPPGTPGHDRFVLGKCGIPHPDAVYKHFKYERDRIEAAALDPSTFIGFRSGLHLSDGQPVGWLRVGFLPGGIMIPVRGLMFRGESPRHIADRIREVAADTPEEREVKPILADPKHEMYGLLRRAGLRLARAKTEPSVGIGHLRNALSAGRIKLLRQPDKRCATPDLLVEIEEHKFSEKGVLEEEQWSQLRPLEYIATAHRGMGPQQQQAGADLREGLAAARPAPVETKAGAFTFVP